jgi:hypothetical protein
MHPQIRQFTRIRCQTHSNMQQLTNPTPDAPNMQTTTNSTLDAPSGTSSAGSTGTMWH